MERPCGKPALAASILLHGALAAALVASIDSAAPMPHGSGAAGIAVSLSPGSEPAGRGAAPAIEAVDDAAVESVPTEQAGEDASLVDPEAIETIDPDAAELTAATPVETADVSPEVAPTPIETAAAIQPELTPPGVDESAEPRSATPTDAADVPPQSVTATTPTKVAAKKPTAPATAAPAAPSSAATTDGAQGDQAPLAADGADARSAGAAGIAALDRNGPEGAADYMALLQAWLEKHKQYPRRAQIRRLQGTALLYFAIDADGSVLRYRVTRSSGHALLDAEVEAMIRRATPLPAVPASMRGARLEFVVPVQFALR